MFLAYVALYLAFAAATARAIFELRYDSGFLIMLGLLAFYLLLLLSELPLIAQNLTYLHIINGLQTAIALILLLFIGDTDYFSLLFIPPCTQSILSFPRKTALIWIITISALMVAAQLITFPIDESIGYVIIYPTAIFLFTALSYLAKQAQAEQNRSEALLADLQLANKKLQDYAIQVKELATANERNRLARELHDSVTQIIFGLTLSAQAARILIDRNPARAAAELDHLQTLAQNALAEMRALIQELHPKSGNEASLSTLLQRLSVEHESNNGLMVDLQIYGENRLPTNIESELFRIAQEALNNVLKHAKAEKVEMTLNLEHPTQVSMKIQDNGIGFDPALARAIPGHLGLTSMQERIEALGGTITIDSQPGKGTRLQVELNLEQEVAHV